MTGPDGLRHGRLVVAEGWRVDALSADRLDRQLGRAPDAVAAVAPGTGPIPSGSSYRVHAERAALEPWEVVRPADGDEALGAALVRHGVSVEPAGPNLRVIGGRLSVDTGAHAHDPATIDHDLRAASPLGRPPFPRRPVVVLLGIRPEPRATRWALSVVDDLIDGNVEARVAVPELDGQPLLTQPATPTEASLDALHPDVVVTLDRAASDRAEEWCPDNRTLTVIEWVAEDLSTELVSWRIGSDHGRVRARAGVAATAADVAPLAARLCGGPHPRPPRSAVGVGA